MLRSPLFSFRFEMVCCFCFIGYRLLAISFWPLALSFWLLAVSCQLLVIPAMAGSSLHYESFQFLFFRHASPVTCYFVPLSLYGCIG